MAKNMDRTSAVQAADVVEVRVEPSTCDQCQGECWSAEVHAVGTLGREGWRTCLLYVDHTTMSAALLSVARAFGAIGGTAREREARAWLLEHQPRLW